MKIFICVALLLACVNLVKSDQIITKLKSSIISANGSNDDVTQEQSQSAQQLTLTTSTSNVNQKVSAKSKPTDSVLSGLIYVYCKHYFEQRTTQTSDLTAEEKKKLAVDTNTLSITSLISQNDPKPAEAFNPSDALNHPTTSDTQKLKPSTKKSTFSKNLNTPFFSQLARQNTLQQTRRTTRFVLPQKMPGHITETAGLLKRGKQLANNSKNSIPAATSSSQDSLSERNYSNISDVGKTSLVSKDHVTSKLPMKVSHTPSIKTSSEKSTDSNAVRGNSDIFTGVYVFFQRANKLLRYSFYKEDYYNSSPQLTVSKLVTAAVAITCIFYNRG